MTLSYAPSDPFAAPGPTLAARAIVHRTRGVTHGPITRLVSPGDLGELIKPFVFLDFFAVKPGGSGGFGWHPHSGIATVSVILTGATRYEETTGAKGVLSAGSVEWMRAGKGVWHTGSMTGTDPVLGYQLWIALPPELEGAPAASQYLQRTDVPEEWPYRLILGQYGTAKSPVAAPPSMNYLLVELKADEHWSYLPPAGHTVAWIAVHAGKVLTPAPVSQGELAVFERSETAIEFVAEQDSSFVLGSAIPHPHDLVLGSYSVHTSVDALVRGESEIRRILANDPVLQRSLR
jgi:redox-sensitive bicupin YhaK (pirin superfamily)